MPFPSNPSNGQTATVNGVLFVYDSTNNVWRKSVSISSGTGGILSTANIPPQVFSTDRVNIWVDSESGRQYLYVNDGNSVQWVELGGGTAGATGIAGATGSSVKISSNPPLAQQGDLWLDEDNGRLAAFLGNGWVEIGAGIQGATGPAGPIGDPGGATGATGPLGNTGGLGATGLTGSTGSTGPQGDPGGATGATGPRGFTGNTGATGSTGTRGATGATGLTGATGIGATGATGLRGNIGPIYTIEVSDNPPVSPTIGSLWWASTEGSLYFYYNDGDSGQWVTAGIGPRGEPGSPGGATGATGIQGYTGYTGATGATGIPGIQGPAGSPGGATGATGVSGSPGGATGATGVAGPQGATGEAGPQGATGVVGPQGDPGPASTIGSTGPQGPQGATGIAGNIGSDGATGATGPIGSTGPQGTIGSTGITGNIGATGATGPIGVSANVIVSDTPPVSPVSGTLWWASDVGVLYFYYTDGDSSQWVTAGIGVGPQGDPGGATGPTGPTGATGLTGNIGATGAQGLQGSLGATGATGSQGPQGATGLLGGYTYTVTNSGASAYLVNSQTDPDIYLIRGFTYYFNVSASGHPFWIKTEAVTGTSSSYNSGVTNNGTESGLITFSVPLDAPSTLYYICQFHSSMVGNIFISNIGIAGATGATGLLPRSTTSATTSVLTNNANVTVNLTGFRGYNLYKINLSHASWLRIYTNDVARITDAARAQGVDPTADTGIITEVITSTSNQTVTLTPAVLGFNDENPPTTIIPCRISNLSGSNVAITITLTLVQTEA